MCWRHSLTASDKCSSNDSAWSTATAEHWKKLDDNSKLLARESARSKRRPYVKCDIPPGSGSWKVFLKRRGFDDIFDFVRAQLRAMQAVESNGQHGTKMTRSYGTF